MNEISGVEIKKVGCELHDLMSKYEKVKCEFAI